MLYDKKLNFYTKPINPFQYLGPKTYVNFDDRGHPGQKKLKEATLSHGNHNWRRGNQSLNSEPYQVWTSSILNLQE